MEETMTATEATEAKAETKTGMRTQEQVERVRLLLDMTGHNATNKALSQLATGDRDGMVRTARAAEDALRLLTVVEWVLGSDSAEARTFGRVVDAMEAKFGEEADSHAK
jgi:hypothetical protein